jgi:hypothetical protein
VANSSRGSKRKRGFIYPCFYDLRDNLGGIDATIETIETAIREFAARYELSSQKDQFLKLAAQNHRIVLNHVDWGKLPNHAAYLYIISVYQQADWFFDALRKQHPNGGSWPGKPEGESVLSYTLSRFGPDAEKRVSPWLKNLFEYYRLVRNRFTHPNKDDQGWKKQLASVLNRIDTIKGFYSVEAPNEYQNISFDDYVLFTRSVKDLALEICDVARPDDDQFAQMLLSLDRKDKLSVSRFSGFLNNEKKLESVLEKHLKVHYNAFLSDYLYSEIKKGLLAQSG